jgi:glucokinase
MPIRVIAAIDLGGTNTAIGLVTSDGRFLGKSVFPTTRYPSPESLIAAAAESIRYLLSQADGTELTAVGIGAPNGNYFKGTIEFAPNLRWKGIVPLAKLFRDQLSVPTVLTNDANAAALGEAYFGAARGLRDYLFITLGTGLGSGIVVNGQLVYGHDGFAGELGHTIVVRHGRPCGCGRRGCLEQYCSSTGLVKTYAEILRSEQAESPDGDVFPDARRICELALAGDAAAFYAFNYTGEMLGFALANAVAMTSPEAIFLFGGLAAAGELLFHPTQISFEKNLLNIYKNKVKILPSGLPENDAALLGAASLAWNEWKTKD